MGLSQPLDDTPGTVMGQLARIIKKQEHTL